MIFNIRPMEGMRSASIWHDAYFWPALSVLFLRESLLIGGDTGASGIAPNDLGKEIFQPVRCDDADGIVLLQ